MEICVRQCNCRTAGRGIANSMNSQSHPRFAYAQAGCDCRGKDGFEGGDLLSVFFQPSVEIDRGT